MPRWITYVVLLISLPLFSQSDDARSMILSLKSTPDDTAKVNTLISLGKESSASDYTTALYYLQHALSLASKLNYSKGIADAYHYFGRVYYYQDQYAMAVEYYQKAKIIYEEIDCTSGLADYYLSAGQIDALYGNYPKAIASYQQALELREKDNDLKGVTICYNNIANVHLEQKNLDIALHYVQKAYAGQKRLNDARNMSIITITLGKIYEEKNALDSALNCYQNALALRQNLHNERLLASAYYLTGNVKIKIGNLNDAISDLEKSLSYFTELEEKTGMVITLLGLSDAYLKLDNYPTAKEKTDLAMHISKETNNKNLTLSCYERYINLFSKDQDYRKAFLFQERYKALKDSLFNLEKTKILSELEMKYQTEKKNKEIELLTAKNDIQQKNIIILALSAALLFIFTILLLYFIRVKSASLTKNAELLEKEKIIHQQDIEIKEKEKRFLQEQLEIKNKELTAKVLAMLHANEWQENIISRLEQLTKRIDDKQTVIKEVNAIIGELERQSKNTIWEDFDKAFQGVHVDFYTKILNICPELTPAEIKIAALLKLNLRTKEIAALTFKSESGIKSTRYRLRKKLKLHSERSLVTFLMQL